MRHMAAGGVLRIQGDVGSVKRLIRRGRIKKGVHRNWTARGKQAGQRQQRKQRGGTFSRAAICGTAQMADAVRGDKWAAWRGPSLLPPWLQLEVPQLVASR